MKVRIQLVDELGAVQDETYCVFPPDLDPDHRTKFILTAIAKKLWFLDAGDTIRILQGN